MKRTFLTRCATALIAVLFSSGVQGQVALPPNFQSQKQAEYNKLSPEISFTEFYDIEKQIYYQLQSIESNAAKPYVPGGPVTQPCLNGNFDNFATLEHWQGAFGNVATTGDTLLYSQFVDSIQGGLFNNTNSHQTLVTAGPDPVIVGLTRTANNTAQAVRLGNTQAQRGAELLAKTFTVTPQASILSFSYALVMQNPYTAQHIVNGAVDPNKQPSFQVRVLNAAGVEIPGLVNLNAGSNIVIADSSNPFFQDTVIGTSTIVYRDWSCVQINLSSLIGQTVTIEFINRDCSQGGHYGYSYIDEFCTGCGADNPTGSIALNVGSTSTCGVGQICCNFSIPVAPNGQTGFTRPMLHIYQNGNLVTTVPGPTYSSPNTHCFSINPSSLGITGGFDYVIEGIFTMSNGPLPSQFVGNPATGQNDTANDDYQVACPSNQCCPGKNLIDNGTFEDGNQGFTSSYVYQPLIGLHAVSTGRYGVLTSAQALTVSPNWITGCPDYGRQLIVNAATENGVLNPKLAWRQDSITLKPGTYRFCGDFRNLRPCALGTTSQITVEIGQALGTPIVATGFLLGNTGCSWSSRQWEFTLTQITTLQISVFIGESVGGDGNDVAMDNFTLVKLSQVPLSDVQFNVNFTPVSGTNYNNATATVVTPLGSGCQHYWKVEEIDANDNPVPNTTVTNPLSWQSLSTNTYIGYSGSNLLSGTAAGKFAIAKRWRFVYGRECPCQLLRMVEHIYGPTAGRGTDPTPVLLSSGEYFGEESGSTLRTGPDAATSIRVYPNPTNNEVRVEMPPLQSSTTLKVFSIAGQELKSMQLNTADTQAEVSLEGLPAGIYLLQMTDSKGEMILNHKVTKFQ